MATMTSFTLRRKSLSGTRDNKREICSCVSFYENITLESIFLIEIAAKNDTRATESHEHNIS